MIVFTGQSISAGTELTIPFDFDPSACQYPIRCACSGRACSLTRSGPAGAITSLADQGLNRPAKTSINSPVSCSPASISISTMPTTMVSSCSRLSTIITNSMTTNVASAIGSSNGNASKSASRSHSFGLDNISGSVYDNSALSPSLLHGDAIEPAAEEVVVATDASPRPSSMRLGQLGGTLAALTTDARRRRQASTGSISQLARSTGRVKLSGRHCASPSNAG
ncbi:unnamed protein product [Protopolystoma xenopodis]|uniref:Uncharacterized protein n=1 Tax=Protopolystoma xenopodis TaxID=117903 RepID=A0A3S5AZB7_9PLAT|nr:unnamed protein product [Protopolystoma xenopodis]